MKRAVELIRENVGTEITAQETYDIGYVLCETLNYKLEVAVGLVLCVCFCDDVKRIGD